jgi:hypothetical protein
MRKQRDVAGFIARFFAGFKVRLMVRQHGAQRARHGARRSRTEQG